MLDAFLRVRNQRKLKFVEVGVGGSYIDFGGSYIDYLNFPYPLKCGEKLLMRNKGSIMNKGSIRNRTIRTYPLNKEEWGVKQWGKK